MTYRSSKSVHRSDACACSINALLKTMADNSITRKPLSLWACGPSSNTPIPPPSPLTTPNDSSVGSRTSARLCKKVPFGYNGMPQIHSQNCPFPFDDHHPHSLSQTASRSNQPFCHSTLSGPSDRHTNRRTDGIDDSLLHECLQALHLLY